MTSLLPDNEINAGRAAMPAEVASVAEQSATPPPFRHGFSWLVQLRDGRILRVDADRCSTTNGILVFFCGPREEQLSAAFEYGDWKRVSLMDRETGFNAGWHVLKEKRR
jgi:hypothetical protein